MTRISLSNQSMTTKLPELTVKKSCGFGVTDLSPPNSALSSVNHVSNYKTRELFIERSDDEMTKTASAAKTINTASVTFRLYTGVSFP